MKALLLGWIMLAFSIPHTGRQRLLTVGIKAWGGVLDAHERFVDREHIGDEPDALHLQ